MKKTYTTFFFIILFFWLALSGKFEVLFLFFATISTLFVFFICFKLNIFSTTAEKLFSKIGIYKYGYWLLGQIIYSSFKVAKVVFSRSENYSSKFIEIQTNLDSNEKNVIFANSITLTPGTLTTDVKEGSFEIHILEESSQKSFLDKEMETKIKNI